MKYLTEFKLNIRFMSILVDVLETSKGAPALHENGGRTTGISGEIPVTLCPLALRKPVSPSFERHFDYAILVCAQARHRASFRDRRLR